MLLYILLLFSPLPKQADDSLLGSWEVQWGGDKWEWSVDAETNYWRSPYGAEGGGAIYPVKGNRVDFDYRNDRWGMELERTTEGYKGTGWRAGSENRVNVKLTRAK